MADHESLLLSALSSRAKRSADVARAAGIPQGHAINVLHRLAAAGAVERRGRAWRYRWRLPNHAPRPCAFCGEPFSLADGQGGRLFCGTYCRGKASRLRRSA